MMHKFKTSKQVNTGMRRGRATLWLLLLGCFFSSVVSEAQACTPHSPCNQCLCPGDLVYDPGNAYEIAADEAMVAWGTAAKESRYLSFIEGIGNIGNLFSGSMDLTNARQRASEEALLAASNLRNASRVEDTNAQIATAANNKLLAADAKRDMENSKIDSDQFLCNVIKTREALPAMEEFEQMGAAILEEGIDATYRGPGENGNSGMYVYDLFQLGCGRVATSPNPTMNIIDQPPTDCQAPYSLPGTGYDDLDKSASEALSRDNVYTLPPVRRSTQTINGRNVEVISFNPDPEDEGQLRWMKAAQYCYTAAGPRPSPPYGREGLTSKGMDIQSKFVECRAKERLFVRQCTNRLMSLTRPDCANTDMAPFCDASKEACLAAQDAELSMGAAYANCHDGLSRYQLEHVSVRLCGATRRLQSSVLSAASEADKLNTLTQCSQLQGQWQSRISLEDQSFMRGVQGLQSIRSCYDEVKALQKGQTRKRR